MSNFLTITVTTTYERTVRYERPARRFSHWEQVHEPGYYQHGYYYPPRSRWYPIYVDDVDYEIEEYQRQARRALALKQKLDAEAAATESAIRLMLKKAQLSEVLAISQGEELKRLAHMPAIHFDQVRRK
jgi:hypothetical protein